MIFQRFSSSSHWQLFRSELIVRPRLSPFAYLKFKSVAFQFKILIYAIFALRLSIIRESSFSAKIILLAMHVCLKNIYAGTCFWSWFFIRHLLVQITHAICSGDENLTIIHSPCYLQWRRVAFSFMINNLDTHFSRSEMKMKHITSPALVLFTTTFQKAGEIVIKWVSCNYGRVFELSGGLLATSSIHTSFVQTTMFGAALLLANVHILQRCIMPKNIS